MRYLVWGGILLFSMLFSAAGPVRADAGLTDAVAAAFLVRTVEPGLHDIAHARVAEISAAGSLDHAGQRPGTAEVLAWNSGTPNPIGEAVEAWIGSPVHRDILSNRAYGRIGCAETVVAGVHWFACVLAPGPLPSQGGSSGTTALPDTSMSSQLVEVGGPRWRITPT
jgi:hypothetical protein